MVSVPLRREQAQYAVLRGLSQRRSCTLMKVHRSHLKYAPKQPHKDAFIIEKMKALSAQYPRFGARRIRVFLKKEGIYIGKEKCARLWAKSGLQVPKKRSRKKVKSSEVRLPKADCPNRLWSYDFVHDACANGQKLKCLTVIDEYTRECLAIEVSSSIRSAQVIEVLSRLMSLHGVPTYLRSDNGPEFVSKALLEWVQNQSIDLRLIEPGKPWQNGTNESFNGKFRDECLAMEWFRNRLEAKVVIENWRMHYNQIRPHSSLGYQTPNEFKMSLIPGVNFSRNVWS